MFKKILIANRGEIACRVIKTARRMGIKTVAVYSDADAAALHVKMADEAVHIGPPPAAESYLLADKIIAAVKQTGAQAVHPGYGFLSENTAFAERLQKEGIAFIGPNVRAIQAMGDKIESKKLAAAAKVNTVPGYLGVIKDTDEAVKISSGIGYPVMLKASAGGGGKGMRIAWNEADVREGFPAATAEAISSFGDDRVFVEKFVTEPRHIEIQVLADKHGNTLYLGERECSIQRRHQKVVEEAPSPFLDEATRKAMGEQSVALCRAVNYESAGTVEFIVDKDRNFYFLEMNTRLQVEHPVTELITGIDLVEQMIRVAAGEKLSITQDDVKLNGWAMESRVYAEDPFRNFLPSIGRLVRYQPPAESVQDGVTVRNDTGVFEGAEISMYYDPMIAKLCTHAPTRIEAIVAMNDALDAFHIRGIQHNVPFVAAVMEHPRFREGRLTTAFIAEEWPEGFHGTDLSPEVKRDLAALTAFIYLQQGVRAGEISGQIKRGYQNVRSRAWVITLDGVNYPVDAVLTEGGCLVTFDGASKPCRVITNWTPVQPVMRATVDGRKMIVQIDRQASYRLLTHRGATVKGIMRSERAAQLFALMPEKIAPDLSKFLLCPMPGLVVSIAVEVGQEVKAGETLAIVEAMKMQNILRAESDGVVSAIKVKAGDSLAVDQVILEFE
ncbi:MAG TPA: acetyl/propionyl/methylcrotonyl-CoA carboxylase subunit alpha [Alphaproteobacteria bacterium]|nr:acetyl/propionyl/methylcrotonyl-CoA carboxylase subunit alpha [Alphaproteobacteria bacterium]